LRLKPGYAWSFLFPCYISALLVRSPGWSVALSVLIVLGLVAVLVVKTCWFFTGNGTEEVSLPVPELRVC